MSYEIVSTETDAGLIKGTNGFCPVAISQGIPKHFIKPLVDLAKRQADEANNLREQTKDFYSHLLLKLGGQQFNVLTRGSRSNVQKKQASSYIVHQILLEHKDLDNAGPAAVLADDSLWITRWSAKPQLLKERILEPQPLSPRICQEWEKSTGDAGWAGSPVEAWEQKKSCVLLTPQSMDSRDLIKMFLESQSLIAHEHRWQILLAVAAWHPFEVDERFWTAVDRGTQWAVDSLHREQTQRIDLGGDLNRANCKYSEEARSGTWIRLSGTAQPGQKTRSSIGDQHRFIAQSELKTAEPSKLSQAEVTIPAKNQTADTDQEPQKSATTAGLSQGRKIALPQTPSGWVRFSLVSLILASVGIGLWMGAQTVTNLASALNFVETSAVTPGQAAIPGESGRAMTDSTQDRSTQGYTGGIAPIVSIDSSLSLETVRAGVENAEVDPDFDLGIDERNLKQWLFSIPIGSVHLTDYLDVKLETASERITLDWNKDRLVWSIKTGKSDRPFAKIFAELDETSEGDERCNFFWEWVDQPEKNSNYGAIQAGRIVVRLRDDSNVGFEMPLTSPAKSDRFPINHSMIKKQIVQPHLSEYLCRQDVFPLFKWRVTGARIPVNNAKIADIWLEPEVDESLENQIVVPINEEALRRELGKLLESDLSESNIYSELADTLLKHHGPFGLRMVCSFSLAEQSLELDIKTQAMIESPGDDISSVVLRPGRKAAAMNQSEKLASVKTTLLEGLMEHLGVGGEVFREIISAGGNGCKEVEQPERQLKAALGGLLYRHSLKYIELPMQVRLSRTRQLGRQGDMSFTVTAVSFDQ